MDVDPAPLVSTSGVKRTPSPSLAASTSKRPKHDSMAIQSVDGVAMIRRFASDSDWQHSMDKAKGDESKWTALIRTVLSTLTGVMDSTDRRNDYIGPQSLPQADQIVNGFSDEHFREWKEGVENGITRGDWEGLLEHPSIRRPPRQVESVGVPIDQRNAVINAWKSDYLGDSHKLMLRVIDEVHQRSGTTNYAKVVPVAQSSGTGKSKTVDKIATERILFPLCLREDIGPNYFAYPPSDDAVRTYFLTAPGAEMEEKCMEYLRSFLRSFFVEARLQVENLFPADQTVAYAHMVQTFYDFFNTPNERHKFYNAVIAKSKLLVNENVSQATVLSQDFICLHDLLKQRCSDWPATTTCPILISIDEIHVLFQSRPVDVQTPHTLYSRLKSVLSKAVSSPFCTIFLSTATNVAKLAPSKAVAPSMRERADDNDLSVPFTELPFDVHIIADPLYAGRYDLKTVGTMEFTAKFGRPLFFVHYVSRKAQEENHGTVVHGIMQIVREKLYGQRWPPHPQEPPSYISSIAVVSARLLLDLSPASVRAREYEEELVRSHLRMLYSVHANLAVMVTGTSSEPLIAEASAHIMNHRDQDQRPLIDVWSLLGKYVEDGLAAQGTIGELIGRALSITAMDDAINALDEVCELKYQTPVSVADYYQALLTDEAWETLRLSVPANRATLTEEAGAMTFEQAFASAYFHFSHYAKANDAIPMHDGYAWAGWLRGTAVLCQLNQELSDRVHYIYFSDQGNVGPTSMSVDLNQDKTGETTKPHNAGTQRAEDLKIFQHGNKLPYIAAVHCYALTNDEGIFASQPTPYSLRGGDGEAEAPRYQIDFRGLAAYRGLTETTKDAIRSMINGSKNYLFKNHPRPYALDSLRQMLPLLSGDSASTAWIGGFKGIPASSQAKTKGKEVEKGKGKGKGKEEAKGKAAMPLSARGAVAKKDEPGPSNTSSASMHLPQQTAGESRSAKRKQRKKKDAEAKT